MTTITPEKITTECLARIINNGFDKIVAKFTNVAKDQLEKLKIDFDIVFKKYLKKCVSKYGKVKTVLYMDAPQPLYDFFICPTLIFGGTAISAQSVNNILTLPQNENCFLVQASGGQGKSILLRHFLLDEIKQKEFIPVFIELRDFDDYDGDFYGFILESLKLLGSDLKAEYLDYALESGCFLFLFDGFDELTQSKRKVVLKQINSMCNRYDNNKFILSSRPLEREEVVAFRKYYSLKIVPFEKYQALALIKNLKFDRKIKGKFVQKLDGGLFDKYSEFASNPLLLTIMLLTFDQYADIPEKMHLFYSYAFETLYSKHDATKDGYIRKSFSGLTKDVFFMLLIEFCFLTYIKEAYSFSYDVMKQYLEISKERTGINVNTELFIKDLRVSICVLMLDGLTYSFVHRSFQEYFAAKCISEMSNDLFRITVLYMIDNKYNHNYPILSMLIDMKRKKIAEEVITSILNEQQENANVESIKYRHYLRWIVASINMYDSKKIDASINPKTSRGHFVYIFSQDDYLKSQLYIEPKSDSQFSDLAFEKRYINNLTIDRIISDKELFDAFYCTTLSSRIRFIMSYDTMLKERIREDKSSYFKLLGINSKI